MAEKFAYVLCPLANDVVSKGAMYDTLGENSMRRIDDMLKWSRSLGPDAHLVWVFGAGTDAHHLAGPTLAKLQRDYLLSRSPHSVVFANEEKTVFGTQAEMMRVVEIVSSWHNLADRTLTFVFGTQARHLLRARVIKWLFIPGIKARFVQTRHTKVIPWKHEFLGYGKLLAVRLGLGSFANYVRNRKVLDIDKG